MNLVRSDFFYVYRLSVLLRTPHDLLQLLNTAYQVFAYWINSKKAWILYTIWEVTPSILPHKMIKSGHKYVLWVLIPINNSWGGTWRQICNNLLLYESDVMHGSDCIGCSKYGDTGMATRPCIILNTIISINSPHSSVLRLSCCWSSVTTLVRRLGAGNPASSPFLNHLYLMDVFFSLRTPNRWSIFNIPSSCCFIDVFPDVLF